MAENSLKITGLAELVAALEALPPALVAEASGITWAAAEAARASIAAAYPFKTGRLRNGLTIERGGNAVSAVTFVRTTADHANYYEKGTGPRYWAKNGKSTGKMPRGRVFVPIVMAERRRMYEAIAAMLERAGLTVTGSRG